MARFRHIILLVNDLPKTVAFYKRAFDLKATVESPMWTELELDGTVLAVHATEDELHPGDDVHLSFEVEDIAAGVAHLEDCGARLTGEIREAPFGKVAALITPDGHRLSLMEPKAEG